MTDLVSVASNAVASYQRALGTISNNIANVATDGYSRQEVVLQANPVAKVGNTFMGTGVMVDRLQRQYDSFVESNLRSSNSDLLSQEPMVNYANRVIDIMGGPSMGLSSALDQFFGSARNLSADPASSVLRGSFVRDAENLATRFSQLSSQLDLVQSETDQLVEGHVSEMNTTIQQLAEINVQLTKQKNAANQPPDLLDQRDKLLKELSSFARINTYFQDNGSVTVSLGPSITRDLVVDGIKSYRIGTSFNAASPEKVALVIDPYGNAAPLTSINSGKLSGLMSFRQQVLGSSRSALNVLANTVVKEVNDLHKGGIDAYGNTGGDLFKIDATNTAAAGTIQLAFSDPLRVAAAAQFRVVEAPNNISGVDASVSYETPVITGPKLLNEVLLNSASSASAINLSVTDSRPFGAVATIPNGFDDVQIFLGEAKSGQQLQVFTRDGRQIVGSSIADNAELQGQLMTAANGFVPNASFSDQYLNVNGPASYKDLSVFYGAKANMQSAPQWDMTVTDPEKHAVLPDKLMMPANLEGDRMLSLDAITSGMFTLNGVSLGAMSPATPGAGMQASDLKNWINAAITSNPSLSKFSVIASNDITIPAKQIDFSSQLTLPDFSSPSDPDKTITIAAQSNLQGMIAAINAKSEKTRVVATQDMNGDLVLSNISGFEGNDIKIVGPIPNSLGIAPDTYKGRISITRELSPSANTSVELGFGTGKPSDLAKLGFKTGAYINGSANEDLLVFVTGSGDAKISATYTNTQVDANQSPAIEALKILSLPSISSGMFTLNGTSLGAATPATPSAGMQASDLKNWINKAISAAKQINAADTRLSKFSVSASNDIKISAKQINLKLGVTLIGATGIAPVYINASDTNKGFASLKEMVNAIKASSNFSQITASIDANGDLILSNVAGTEGNNITVSGVAPNSLGIAAGTYKGNISVTSEFKSSNGTPVVLGFSANTPAYLTNLGLETAASTGNKVDAKESLRKQSLQIKFDSPTHYTITDIATQTEVASRNFDPTQIELVVTYQGLRVGFSSPPKTGDVYTIDGNKDGTGNNENMLAIANLETKGVMGGGKTMGAYYIDHVNDMGNIARQAAISQSALQVVYDQAVTARDEVSGVSLDEEAANLIRFQQAYQAAAKILQVASQLFDSVLQVR